MRTGPGNGLPKFVATFGLMLTIFGCVARTPAAVPYAVGLYITSAYWFTASTSFANPAVTIARSLSNTFAGIAPPPRRCLSRPDSRNACRRRLVWMALAAGSRRKRRYKAATAGSGFALL